MQLEIKRKVNIGMAERPVLVGLIPQAVVLDTGDQVSWISDAGNLRVEFDSNRCPFSSNVFPGASRDAVAERSDDRGDETGEF